MLLQIIAGMEQERQITQKAFTRPKRTLFGCDAGVTAVEYGLIACGIAAVIIPATVLTGVDVKAVMQNIASQLVAVVESTAWPSGIIVGDFSGYTDLNGTGAITAGMLAANVIGKSTIRFFNSGSANISGLTAEQVLSITGGGGTLTLKDRGAGITFNPTPPAGGSINVVGTTYQYLNSSGSVIASVKIS